MLHAVDDDKLDDAAGGYIFDTHSTHFDENGNGYHRFEVIDDKTGDVLRVAKSKRGAYQIASDLGMSLETLNWTQLARLRETGSIN